MKILDRAFLAKQEQEEEVKRANRLILATKCHVIRDAQIAEKNVGAIHYLFVGCVLFVVNKLCSVSSFIFSLCNLFVLLYCIRRFKKN